MDLPVLLVEGLYLVLFLATLVRYARHRDPISRDLALMFSWLAVASVSELWEAVTGALSPVLAAIGGVLLLAQPIFVVHLVSLVRRVPRLLLWGGAVALVATALATVLVPAAPEGTIGLKTIATAALVVVFVFLEAAAAVYLLFEAIRRDGPVALRMSLAAISTGIFASALVVMIVGNALSASPEAARLAGLALALLAGIGYVFAFLTPGLLRRVWQGQTTVDYAHQLIARSGDPVGGIWRGFTDAAVGMQGGAAAMLTGPASGLVAVAAATGMVAPAAIETMRWSELDQRLDAGPTRWDVPVGKVGPIRGQLAEAAGARFVSVITVEVPGSDQRAALVLLSTHRAFFHPSDAELLAALGAQTAIVAERRAVMAEQEALTERLASTIEALRSASAAKSDFVASMSHEFRTPLSAIIGFSDLMATEPGDGDRVAVPVEWVDHIQRGGQHLLALVNDVLDLARVEAGRLDLQLEPVDVALAVTEAVNGLRPLADRKRLRLAVATIGVTVAADRGRVRQMLYNLISNAIKYTPDEGLIRVSVDRAPGVVRIAVVDSGIGIAPEDHDRVFEEFQQVGAPSERQPGTGLGLAVTRRLAEAHAGRIELDSARGRGSTFTIVLPDASVQPEEPAHGGPTADPARRPPDGRVAAGEILLIEDDPSAVRLLREYLETAGYRVRVAPNGETGLASAIAERPAAIILDVLLPGIDGWEVLRRLKADERVQDVPVVIVTIVEEREVGLALGAVDYLVKPIHRGTLLGCLSRYVPAHPMEGPARRVLVVDDEPSALALIRGALEPEGVEVLTACGGREAIEWAARGDLVDLVICDLVMPDVDGFEVIAALKANRRTAGMPIVVCTGHDLTHDQKDKLNGQILGIVAKGQDARTGLLEWLAHAAPTGGRA